PGADASAVCPEPPGLLVRSPRGGRPAAVLSQRGHSCPALVEAVVLLLVFGVPSIILPCAFNSPFFVPFIMPTKSGTASDSAKQCFTARVQFDEDTNARIVGAGTNRM